MLISDSTLHVSQIKNRNQLIISKDQFSWPNTNSFHPGLIISLNLFHMNYPVIKDELMLFFFRNIKR